MEFNNTQHKSSLCHLISHCVFRPVSGREHHISYYFLAGIEGCGDKDQACLFVAYHDDSGWCGCSCIHGVYGGFYGLYGDFLSHTAGLLWGDWRVCVIESPRSSLNKISCTRQFESKLSLRPFAKSLDKRRIFENHPDPLSSGAREETALLGTQSRYAIRLAAPSKVFDMIMRYGTAVCWWGMLVRTVLYYNKKIGG